MGVPGEGTAQREATGLGTDERGAAEGDRAAEGIDAVEIAERAAGRKAGAENGEGLGADGDAAAEFERRAIGHGRSAGVVAEGGRVADRQEAGVDGGRTRVGAGAGQHDRTGATEGQATGARDGVVGGVGARAVDDERSVVDDRAGTEGARVRAGADLEGAGGDGEDTGEGVEAVEDEGSRGGLADRAAAVDFRHVLERAGLEEHVVDRAGQGADREAVQVQRGIGETQRRSDGGEAVADALGDRVADVDRTAGDVERGHGGAGDIGRTAEPDRSVDDDVAAGDIDGADRGVAGVARSVRGDIQAGRADGDGASRDIQRTGRSAGIAVGSRVATIGDDHGGDIQRTCAHAEGTRHGAAVRGGTTCDVERAGQDIDGVTGEIHHHDRRRTRLRTAVTDVDGGAAGAGAVADDEAAQSGVEEVHGTPGAVAAYLDRIDVQGVDAGSESDGMDDGAGRRIHREGRSHDVRGGGQDEERASSAAGSAVGIRRVSDAERTSGQAGIEGREAGHVDHRAVRDVRRAVPAELDVDQRGIAHAADEEGTAAGEAQAGLGRRTGIEADGDRAVDLQGLAGADGDDVVEDRVAVADGQAAEARAAAGQVEGRDDRRVGDVAEDEGTVGVELVGRGDGDRPGAAEDDRTVTRDDVAGRQGVGVGAGEEERARVVDESATDGSFGAEGAHLDRGRSADGSISGVGVRADEGRRAGAGEGKAGLARAGTQYVLDREGQGRRSAREGQERVAGGAAVTDPLVGGDRAGPEGQGGDGLIEAAEVEHADGADAAQGQGADGEGVVRAQERRAVRDDGATGVGVGVTEGQRAAARVAEGDAGVRGGLDEGAGERDGASAGEGQGRGADRAVAHGLVGRDAGRREAEEGLAEAVELERRAVAGAAEHDAVGISPGRGRADHERAVLDPREAGITVRSRERQDTAGRHAADEVAATVDAVGEGQGAGAGDDEAAAVGDDRGRRQGADDAAVAELQGGSGSDHGRPLIDVRAREHEGARVDGDAAEAADDGTDGRRAGGVDAQRTVDVDDAGAGDGTASTEGQGLTGGDVGAALVTKDPRQGHVAAAEDVHRTGAEGIRGAGETVRSVEGEDRAASDADIVDGASLSDFERTAGDNRSGIGIHPGQHEFARAFLEETELTGASVRKRTSEGIRTRGDADGQAGRTRRAVRNDRRADRRVGGESVQDDVGAVKAETAARISAEGQLVVTSEAVVRILDDRAGTIDDDVTADGVGRAEDERAAVDDDATRDGLGGGEGQRTGVDGHSAGEIIAGVGEGGLGGAVLDDARGSRDAEGAGERVREDSVVEREARRRHSAFADDDRAVGGVVIEDDVIADLEIGRGAARDDAQVLGASAGGNVPDVVGDTADVALPADGNTADEDGELGQVARDERAGLTAAETGDRADGEGVEISQRGSEIGQQVRTVGQGAAVDGGERDGAGATVGGQAADVHDRRRSAEFDVAEAQRARAEGEITDRKAARDAVTGFDRAAVGDVDGSQERPCAAQDGVGRHVGRDVRSGVAAEGKRAAVDIDRDVARQDGARPHRERAAARLDELAGAGTGDRAAEGGVGADRQLAVEAQEDRAARGARAFEGGDGLDRAIQVELRARDVREADDGIGREGVRDAGLDRPAVEGGLDGVSLGGGEGPHPCPALGQGSRVDEVRGQGAVAGAGEHEGAIDAVDAAGVEATRRAVQGEHARVGTQGERAAVRRTKADGPCVVTADVLQERRSSVDSGIGDITRELETGAGGDAQRGGGTEGARVREAQGARVDDGGAGEGVSRAEGRDAEALLGDSRRTEGDHAAEDEFAGAAQRQGMVSRGKGSAERERAGIAREAGGTVEDDGAAQGVDAGKIAEDARAEAAAGHEETLAAGDPTEDAEGGAGGDHGLACVAAEAGRAAEIDRARVDVRHAGVVGSTGEREHAGAILIEREAAEEAVVDRAAEGGIGRGEGGEHRASRLEAGVGDDAAGTGEGADRGAARAEDVEDAAVDGQRAVEARVAAEGVGVADAQGTGVDGRAAGEGVDARERLHAGAALDEGEIAGDLAAVGPVAREAPAVVGDDVDRQHRRKTGGIRDDAAVRGHDARQRADRLVVTVEVERRDADRADVHDGARRKRVVRPERHDGLLVIEVIVVGITGGVGEPDVAGAGGDHLAGGRGDLSGDVERAARRGEETAGEGGVLDEDRTGKRGEAGGSGQEDRPFTDTTGGITHVDRVREGDALLQLELSGADQVDDIGGGAQGARGFDTEETVASAHVDFAGEVVGSVAEDDHARAGLREADVAGDARFDHQAAGGVAVPLVQDEVLAVARGDRAAGDGDEVGADGRRHEDTAAGDGQPGDGVERKRRGGVEAERVDRDRRSADRGLRGVVDVGGVRIGGAVGGQRDDASAGNGGEAGACVDGRPAAEDAGGVVGVTEEDAAVGAHAGRREVDTRTRARAGDEAEVQRGQRRGRTRAGGAGAARQEGRAVEGLGVRAGSLRRDRQRAAAEFERAGAVDDRRRRRGQGVEVEVDRTTADGGGADVIPAIAGDQRERAVADLDDAGRISADRTDAAVDETGEFGASRAGQGQFETVEVEDASLRNSVGDGGRIDGPDGDVAVELGDVTDGVIEVQQNAGGGAVERVADVEGIGVIEQQGAHAVARARTDDIGVRQVGIDAVEAEDASAFLEEGARGLDEVAVRADAAGEDDRIGLGGAVGVELDASRDEDGGQVGRRGHVRRQGIRGETGDRRIQTEGRIRADEGDRAVAEDGPRIGDIRDFDGAVRTVLADNGSASVIVGALSGRVEEDGAVGIIRRTAGEDHRGVAGDAIGVGEVGATAAETEGGLTVDDVRLERAREGQVLIRTEAHTREVGPTEVERLVGGRQAEGDGTDGPEGDLIQDGGLDAREVRDDRAEGAELDGRRRAEVRQAVEAVAARTDVVGAGPSGVVAREIDGAVAPAGASGEVEVAEELGADRGLGSGGADTRVAHQVERTSQGDIRTEADGTMESPRLSGTFFPSVADDIPVTGQGTGVVAHHELTTVIAVDEDISVGARTEGRAAGVVDCGSGGDRRGLA